MRAQNFTRTDSSIVTGHAVLCNHSNRRRSYVLCIASYFCACLPCQEVVRTEQCVPAELMQGCGPLLLEISHLAVCLTATTPDAAEGSGTAGAMRRTSSFAALHSITRVSSSGALQGGDSKADPAPRAPALQAAVKALRRLLQAGLPGSAWCGPAACGDVVNVLLHLLQKVQGCPVAYELLLT